MHHGGRWWLLLLWQVCGLARSGPYIETSPREIRGLAQHVLVTWNGVVDPKPSDAIHIIAYPHNLTVEVRSITGCQTWRLGEGQVNITLPNFRHDYQVVYHGSASRAISAIVEVRDYPLHGHLALTSKPSEIRCLHPRTS